MRRSKNVRRMSKKVVRRTKRMNTRTKRKNTRKRTPKKTLRRSNKRTNRRTNIRTNRRTRRRITKRTKRKTDNKEQEGGVNQLLNFPGVYYYGKQVKEMKLLRQIRGRDGSSDYLFEKGQLIYLKYVSNDTESVKYPNYKGLFPSVISVKIKYTPLPFKIVENRRGKTLKFFTHLRLPEPIPDWEQRISNLSMRFNCTTNQVFEAMQRAQGHAGEAAKILRKKYGESPQERVQQPVSAEIDSLLPASGLYEEHDYVDTNLTVFHGYMPLNSELYSIPKETKDMDGKIIIAHNDNVTDILTKLQDLARIPKGNDNTLSQPASPLDSPQGGEDEQARVAAARAEEQARAAAARAEEERLAADTNATVTASDETEQYIELLTGFKPSDPSDMGEGETQ